MKKPFTVLVRGEYSGKICGSAKAATYEEAEEKAWDLCDRWYALNGSIEICGRDKGGKKFCKMVMCTGDNGEMHWIADDGADENGWLLHAESAHGRWSER